MQLVNQPSLKILPDRRRFATETQCPNRSAASLARFKAAWMPSVTK